MQSAFRFLSLIFVLAIASCQKPVEEVFIEPAPPEVEPPVESRDSTLLKKMFDISPGDDTSGYILFTYDSLKRPAEQREVIYGTQPPDFNQWIEYRYQGEARLPYLVLRHRRSTREYDWNADDTMFVKYQNGLVSYDSTRSYRFSTKEFFTVAVHTNTRIGDTLFIRSFEQWFKDGQVEFEYLNIFPIVLDRSNGNLLGYIAPRGPEFYYNIFKYNDHPDPVYPFYVPFPMDYYLWEWGPPAYKNLQTYLGMGSSPYGQAPGSLWGYKETTYTYRADGYPIKAQHIYSDGDKYDVAYEYY
ncbi:MAG: hypothetical protein ABWZ25_11415 [Chitinophagaceae bacterium]